jgi:hypothetical protein
VIVRVPSKEEDALGDKRCVVLEQSVLITREDSEQCRHELNRLSSLLGRRRVVAVQYSAQQLHTRQRYRQAVLWPASPLSLVRIRRHRQMLREKTHHTFHVLYLGEKPLCAALESRKCREYAKCEHHECVALGESTSDSVKHPVQSFRL